MSDTSLREASAIVGGAGRKPKPKPK